MDFTQHLQTWTKGDLQQGKWMIGIAVLIIFPICILFIKTSNSLQKGMLIPFGLLFLINVGYGSYLLISKPKYVIERTTQFQLNAEETIEKEVAKIKADDKSYTMTKYVWVGILVLSVFCFFIFNKEYFQGLALGFGIMFMGMLLIDVFLHNRLEYYLKVLQNIT